MLLVVNVPTVSADGPCILDNQGNCAQSTAAATDAVPGPDPATDATLPTVSADAVRLQQRCDAAPIEERTCQWIAAPTDAVAFRVASVMPSRPGSDSGYRFVEQNTMTPSSVGDPSVLASDQRAIYRVSDGYYYVPAPGGLWAVIHYPTDGLPVIEDYVSGPPPANGTAITLPSVGGQFSQAEYDAILVSMEKVVGVTAPIVTTSDEQRALDESTTAANTVPSYRTIDGMTSNDWLTDNRVIGCNDELICLSMYAPTYPPSRECTYPAVGFPTCYTLQADGTWACEEFIVDEHGAEWAVVGTVTFEQMKAAIDEANASVP
jgi:hypothetical protein